MEAENEKSVDTHTEADQRGYPFGLSSRQLFVFVVLVGLLGPGILVYVLEQANLSGVANLVWIVSYGTTIFVVWFIWVRPLNLVGSSGQDPSLTEEVEQSRTETTAYDDESEVSSTVESQAQDSTSPKGSSPQASTQEDRETSDSK